jgi:hypothetical protein
MEEYIAKILGVVTIIILGVGLILGEETIREKFARTGSIVARWFAYSIIDYGLMILSISIVVFLKGLGTSFGGILLASWAYAIATAMLLLFICVKSKKDLTLGQEYRRSIGEIFRRSKITGFFSFFVFTLKALIWDGPERMVEYFQRELGTWTKKWIAIMFLSSIQAFFWTSVYSFSYDGIIKIFDSIYKNLT